MTLRYDSDARNQEISVRYVSISMLTAKGLDLLLNETCIRLLNFADFRRCGRQWLLTSPPPPPQPRRPTPEFVSASVSHFCVT